MVERGVKPVIVISAEGKVVLMPEVVANYLANGRDTDKIRLTAFLISEENRKLGIVSNPNADWSAAERKVALEHHLLTNQNGSH